LLHVFFLGRFLRLIRSFFTNSQLRQVPLPRHTGLRALPSPLPVRLRLTPGKVRARRGPEDMRLKERVQARRDRSQNRAGAEGVAVDGVTRWKP
jgi:hypothetical protein